MGVLIREEMRCPAMLRRSQAPPSPSTDPFIAKLRAARESLTVGALEIRYRLKELEWRLVDVDLDDAS